MTQKKESGAAAVELALILPVILMLLFGIVEFGRWYNASITVTHAARESVRKLALRDTVDNAKLAGTEAAASLAPIVPTFGLITECTSGITNAEVTMKFSFTFDIPFIPSITSRDISKRATMLCGG